MFARFCFVVVLFTISTLQAVDGNLLQLCEQLDYYNKLSLLDCLRYASYGCWCGPGGSGKPVDGIDDCCMHHDHCYRHAKIASHGTCLGYIDIYTSKNGKCLDPKGTCDNALCTCDITIAQCVSDYKYDRKYEFWRFSGRCDNNNSANHLELEAYARLKRRLQSLGFQKN